MTSYKNFLVMVFYSYKQYINLNEDFSRKE